MNPDHFFKQMERRTERELYRKSFRAVTESQASLYKKFESNKKEQFKRGVAREVKWFFISLIVAPLLAFAFYYLFAQVAPNIMINMARYLNSVEMLFLTIAIFCFVGVYIARVFIWALKK